MKVAYSCFNTIHVVKLGHDIQRGNTYHAKQYTS